MFVFSDLGRGVSIPRIDPFSRLDVDETCAWQQVAHEGSTPRDPDAARLADIGPLLLARRRPSGFNRWRIDGLPCRGFFVRQTEAAQKPLHRHPVNRDAMPIRRLRHQIVQGRIRLFGHPSRDAFRHRIEFATTATIALRPRFRPAGFALHDDHVADDLDRNPEPGCSRTMRMPFFHIPDRAHTNCHGMWLAHR